MAPVRKVKLKGERSIESKLRRLAYELEDDANRIRHDYGREYDSLANALASISSQLGKLGRGLEYDNVWFG